MIGTLLLAVVGILAPAADDLKMFEGSWRFESMEIAGKAVDVKDLKDSLLVIKGQTFTQLGSKGNFTIDATAKPKTIDITFTEGPPKGTTMKGIYEIDATTYKLCIGEVGSDRPKVFDSKAKDGGSMSVLKKVKP